MQTEKKTYFDGSFSMEGFVAYEGSLSQKRPVVLVFHAWKGRDEFACAKAEAIAKLGYIGFAVDLYGKARVVQTNEQADELMAPLMKDRVLLGRRIEKSYEAAKTLSGVDSSYIGAVGFCFGGLCALDLARSGLDVRGVASFHGLLTSPVHLKDKMMNTKVLVMHGNDDPMVSLQEQEDFREEMTVKQADWQMHIYGKTMHAFTNPLANDPGFGTVYNPLSDQRSWRLAADFFDEIFE